MFPALVGSTRTFPTRESTRPIAPSSTPKNRPKPPVTKTRNSGTRTSRKMERGCAICVMTARTSLPAPRPTPWTPTLRWRSTKTVSEMVFVSVLFFLYIFAIASHEKLTLNTEIFQRFRALKLPFDSMPLFEARCKVCASF